VIAQQFAKDITLLLKVTGADPKHGPTPIVTRGDAECLPGGPLAAQLSVNIVDYLDNDDYMTAFVWYTNPSNAANQETLLAPNSRGWSLNEAIATFDQRWQRPWPEQCESGQATTTYNLNSGPK